MSTFILEILKITGLQLAAVFGFFLVAGFILSVLQRFTQKQYYQSIGWLGILWTAWIGTPIHELSHWLMAKLFGHHIDSVSLFRPNQASGKLGEVQHSYNPRNLIQQIGNFFIGAAPLLGGVLVLWLLFKFLLPDSQVIINIISKLDLKNFTNIWQTSAEIFKNLFNQTNLHSPKFWIFLYLSFAIASHLAPSSADQKSMWRGLVWLVLVLLVINSIAFWFNKTLFEPTFTWPILAGVFWYALVVSILHALISFIVFLPFRQR